MHRTSIKVSAPNDEKLELCRDLAHEPDFLLEQTMGRFDIVKLEEDPRFEGCEIESVNEYPEVA